MPRLHARMRPFHTAILPAIAMIAGTAASADTPQKTANIGEASLPTGDGAAFRQRMMSWSAPSPESVAQPVIEAPRRAPDLPRLSSGFGTRHDPMRGTLARHAGVDIPAPLGTPIYASADGAIRFAGSAGSYGNMIEIEHPNGIRTRYAHLSRIFVGERAAVKQGQIIALMGSTGRSTGSHLHFEMRANGAAIDPLVYLQDPSYDRRDDIVVRPARIVPSSPFLSSFARAKADETEAGSPDR